LRSCAGTKRAGAGAPTTGAGAVRYGASFALISRLGDGVFWYALITLLVVCDGMDGVFASAHMAATGVIALSLYKGLKRWTRRPRPYAADLRIRA